MDCDREVPSTKKRKAAGSLMTFSRNIPWYTLSGLGITANFLEVNQQGMVETALLGTITVRQLPATSIVDQVNDYDLLPREQQVRYANALRRTEREFTISDHIQNHPHIRKVCAFIGDEYSDKYPQGIVLEYAPKGSVEDYLREQGTPDNNRIFSWALQLARTMYYLHETHHIMHRDLRPANVFVFEDGNLIKLGNFGYGKKISEDIADLSCRNDENIVYCAPEIIADPTAFSIQTFSADVWSFGMFLYQVTHNRKPFANEPPGEYNLRDRIEHGLRPEINGTVHHVFRELMKKCWVLEGGMLSNRPSFHEIVIELTNSRAEFVVPLVL